MTLFDAFATKKHFGSLDGLRALSILGVIWHHCARGQSLFFAEQGAMGVPLFFAISGFLITTLLLRERAAHGDISLRMFYARRSLRIFPLYYAVIAVYVASVFAFERDSDDGREFFHNLPAFLTYTSNWFVPLSGRVIFYFSWSLATEEQFYLVWPTVEKVLRGHRAVVVAVALVGAWWLFTLSPSLLSAAPFVRTVVLSIAPAICMGVLVAHALFDPRSFAWLARMVGHRATSAVLAVAVVVALLAPAPHIVSYALMALLVAACVIREDHVLAPLLRFKPLMSIGQVSYGIYLLHMLVLNVMEKIARKAGVDDVRVVVFVATALATWGVAWVSFHTFEKFFANMKSRFVRST